MSQESAKIWNSLARKTVVQASMNDNHVERRNALKHALALHTKAITFDSKNSHYYHGRAEVYVALGDYRAALIDYHKAVEYAPLEKKESSRKDLREYHREYNAAQE